MVHKVIETLKNMKASWITVVDVKALGDGIDHTQLGLSAEVGIHKKW